MKHTFSSVLLILLAVSMLLMSACGSDDIQGVIDNNTKKELSAPTNLRVDEETSLLLWNAVEYASGYTILVDQTTYTSNTNAFSLKTLKSGTYTVSVKANGDGVMYVSSPYSDTISYTRVAQSGNEYEDDVVAAFREFDEINTKNSFLGYGIDIINASAITSKNVLMTYPIFDMDKLMDEKLLKSNEHYNSFEVIEGATIEEFTKSMGNSTSVSSGANVSGKGNVYGADVSASASLTTGVATGFTKTSSLVESQYFLEIIAENQSYWLILQTSEQRYKDLLSEEFKADLYNPAITPAQLFAKYGTHMLTSVAMGGNICMYYTMYSYEQNVTNSNYAEVSSTLKTNVEVAYGGASAGAGTENSFSTAYTYSTVAQNYGIYVDKKIISAGGGSFGINNEQTLYNNYHDWQKSLDMYPVVIGVKDANSLYPIWNLLDLNVEGATERYTELYNYFQEYGLRSYNTLCESYAITPTVPPTSISNITVGSHKNYSENQTVNVKSGEVLQISFDVEPHNANKYQKTFSVDNTNLATVDDSGVLTIASDAPGGKYVKVKITAGSVSKQITLYIVNTYSVTFNTRVSGLDVAPIIGIYEGYTIQEPVLQRDGYVLEGWYTDTANTKKFNFDEDCITSHMTLYAKWVAIKPVVTFDTGAGSAITSQTLAYNTTVSKPKNPVLAGYSFGGWYVDEEYTEAYDFATTVISDLTLYAKWTAIEYTVTFVTNGGTQVVPVTTSIEDGYKISEPVTVRTFYTLDGWYRDEAMTQKFYFEFEITADTTLYAKWSPTSVTVRFVDTDGTSPLYDDLGAVLVDRTTNVEQEFKIAALTPAKAGYTFAGWYLDGAPIDPNTYVGFKPRENGYTLVAMWTVNSYSVTFLLDGEKYESRVFAFGETVVYPKVSVEGHTFSGWQIEGQALPETMPARDLTIFATLALNTYTIEYYVDEQLYATETHTYGETIVLRAEPFVEGKEFYGWTVEGMEELPQTMPARNIRVEGSFEKLTYNIYYVVDGVTVAVREVNKGFAIPEYVPSAKEGHSFSGWTEYRNNLPYEMPEIMPARDVEAHGTYTVNTYTITFDTKGGNSIPAITQAYGTVITAPADPTKTGYTFDNWDIPVPTTMPAGNLTITAQWIVDRCTITFVDEDGVTVLGVICQDYGTAIEWPVNPEKTGYTGIWDTDAITTMPAENVLVKAVWTVNQYTVTFLDFDGVVMYTGALDYGTVIEIPDTKRAGYNFNGWDQEVPATVPDGDLIITANRRDKYTSAIVYEVYGVDEMTEQGQNLKGTFDRSDVHPTVSYGYTQIDSAYASTYGNYYNFLGWFTENGIQITNGVGTLVDTQDEDVIYVKDGKWVYESFDTIALYARWEQVYKNYKYITTLEEFKTIQENTEGYYMILEDISSMGNVPMIETFTGVLDGQGHTLSGWRTEQNSYGSYGLFKYNYGTIQNLNIDDFQITSSNPYTSGYVYAGLVCAYNFNTLQDIVIKNSKIHIDIGNGDLDENAYAYVGFLCGYNERDGRIIRCGVQGGFQKEEDMRVYASTKGKRSSVSAGFIAGFASGTITDVFANNGWIYTYVSGEHKGNHSIFNYAKNCWHGSPQSFTGGLIGESENLNLIRAVAHDIYIQPEIRHPHGDSEHGEGIWGGTIIAFRRSSSLSYCYSEASDTLFGSNKADSTSGAQKLNTETMRLSDLPDTFKENGWTEDEKGNPCITVEKE